MIKSTLTLLAIVYFWGLVGTANATLIEDQVEIGHWVYGSYIWQTSVTVQEGIADTVTYPPSYYSVDMEGNGVFVELSMPSFMRWAGGYGFNGLIIGGLDDSLGGNLTGVNVSTNINGWDMSRLSYTFDSVSFDWQELYAPSGTYFNASFEFEPDPVPEPATFFLLGSGLAGLAFYRREWKK